MLRFSWILAFWMARCVGASSKNDDFPPRRGLKPDPFVQAAPLIVAMSCRDGVAILAAHPAPSSEPLLFYDYNEDEPVTVNDESSLTKTADGGRGNPPLFLDLPLNYEGSLRIQAVGTAGTTALVTCGWRVDGTGRLVTVARERTDIERQTFGEENSSILPTQLSLYMAMCAVSERVRYICFDIFFLGLWTADCARPFRTNAKMPHTFL